MTLEWLFAPLLQRPVVQEERKIVKVKARTPISTAPPPEVEATIACMNKAQEDLSRALDDAVDSLEGSETDLDLEALFEGNEDEAA